MANSPEVQELCKKCEKRVDCLTEPDDHHVVDVGEERICIAIRPLTILVPSADINLRITIPGAVEIGSPETLTRADSLTQSDLDILHGAGATTLFNKVFSSQSIKMPESVAELRLAGHGVRHVVGMIVLILNALCENKRVHLVNPETHLHPSAQAGLADMLSFLVRRGGGDGKANK
jgi:hypothetical protein